MSSDRIVKLDMNEVDDKSQNFTKQDYSMSSASSNTTDLLNDFLNRELNSTNPPPTPQQPNNGIGANNSQTLPSDLQFLRMDSFPPVSSIQDSISANQFDSQINRQQTNSASQFGQNFPDSQTSPFTTNVPIEMVPDSQFQKQSPSKTLSTQNQAQTIIQTQNPMQFMISNESNIQNSQFKQQSSPQTMNEVSSSVVSPDTSSLQFDEVSSPLTPPSINSMPVTHSSPATTLITEPPTVNSGILQNLIQPDSTQDKMVRHDSNTVFSNRRFSQTSTPINMGQQTQISNLPTSLITNVQNTGLPPGAILVLTSGQFQTSASQSQQFPNQVLQNAIAVSQAQQFPNQSLQNTIVVSQSQQFPNQVLQNTTTPLTNQQQFLTQTVQNSPSPFNNQTAFQPSIGGLNTAQFTFTNAASPQNQMITSPVLSNSNITSPTQLTQFATFGGNQFQSQGNATVNNDNNQQFHTPITEVSNLQFQAQGNNNLIQGQGNSVTNNQFQTQVSSIQNMQFQAPANAVTNTQFQAPVNIVRNAQFQPPVNTVTNTQFQAPVNTVTNAQFQAPVNTVTNTQFQAPVNTVTNTQFQAPVNTVTNTQFQTPVNTQFKAQDSATNNQQFSPQSGVRLKFISSPTNNVFQGTPINNSPQSVDVQNPALKMEPPVQQNVFQFNNLSSSQSQIDNTNNLKVLADKLDSSQYSQLKELINHLYCDKSNINSEFVKKEIPKTQTMNSVPPNEQITLENLSNQILRDVKPSNPNLVTNTVLPAQTDLLNQFTILQNVNVQSAQPDQNKLIVSKLLEKFLRDQVEKQVKEEEIKRGNIIIDTKPINSEHKINPNLDLMVNLEKYVSEAVKSQVAEANAVHAGQKRQLSPTRLVFQTDSSNIGSETTTPLPMETQNNFDYKNAPSFQNLLSSPPLNDTFQLSNTQSYRNVEQFSEDLTQFMEPPSNQMDVTNQQPKLLISSPSVDESNTDKGSSMLRKILTAEIDTGGNSSPSPSPISSPEIQLESPSSLSSPNSALFDGNTTLQLLQKSEELNLNSDNLDETPNPDLWNTAVFSDDDNVVPPKSHKSKRNHDTHSTTFDKAISVEKLFDAGGASFQFTQFGAEVIQFGTADTTKGTAVVAGGESLKSVVPVVKPAASRKMKEASLSGQFPSKLGGQELRILTQPEEQHRARYQTEGSRGAVKDISQQSHPVIQLIGVKEPATLQVFIANESGRIKPHGFYQACRVCGKNSTQCTEKTIDGTVVIEIEMVPSTDMTVSIDCVGILKLRNADVEKRIGMAKAKTKKKNNTRARMVFRVTVKKPDGNFQTLQSASNSILCTQPIGQPEIGRISLNSGSVIGGESLFVIGKNFMKGTKVLFRELALDDGSVIWERDAEIDTEFFQQQHLICTVPEYHTKDINTPAIVQIVIKCSGKTSDPQRYSYNPVPVTIKKEVPMEIDEEQKSLTRNSPLAIELRKFIQQTQNSQASNALFPTSPALNLSGLTTQPVGSVSVAGHPGLQTIAGHDKMIMTSSNQRVAMNQQGENQPILMVNNNNSSGLNQPSIVSFGTSSPNQPQAIMVLVPANNTAVSSPTTVTASNEVEYLQKLLRDASNK